MLQRFRGWISLWIAVRMVAEFLQLGGTLWVVLIFAYGHTYIRTYLYWLHTYGYMHRVCAERGWAALHVCICPYMVTFLFHMLYIAQYLCSGLNFLIRWRLANTGTSLDSGPEWPGRQAGGFSVVLHGGLVKCSRMSDVNPPVAARLSSWNGGNRTVFVRHTYIRMYVPCSSGSTALFCYASATHSDRALPPTLLTVCHLCMTSYVHV